MDYPQYIRQNFAQGAFLPENRVATFLDYAKESAALEHARTQDAIQRQPWLQAWYQPRDEIRFQIDHMLRITGSQAVSLMSEKGMHDKSRQMLLLEPPGSGSDDTVRGTLYEPWILAMADQSINPHGKANALPNIIQAMGSLSVPGLSAAPDNLYWAKDHFLILDAKCPREPHTTPPDAYVAQLHFYEAALRHVMREQYPEWTDAPVQKILAQGDILRGRVSFLDIPTVPNLSETLWNNAQVLYRHVTQTQGLWPEPPQPVFSPDKLPQVEQVTLQLLELKDRKATMEQEETVLRERLLELLGNDPETWPKLKKDVGGLLRTSWPRTADDRLLEALREHGLPTPEKLDYDTDGMAQALRNAGISLDPFIRDRRVDVATAIKALETAGVPRAQVQTPGFSLIDKRPTPQVTPTLQEAPAVARGIRP